ncbi:hypothetical protein Tco_0792833 [Tanacetum coccineum]
MDELIAFRVPEAIEESVATHVVNEVKNQVLTHVLDVTSLKLTLRKRPHDDQDPLKNCDEEKNQKKQKFAIESSSGKEKVTFESTDYEAQPSSTDKIRRHEEWFTKDAYTNYQWVDKEKQEVSIVQ